MRKIILLILLSVSGFVFSQKEGQDFCKGNSKGSYFPLDITKKKIYWYNTFYYEVPNGTKTINEKQYVEFVQEWENGEVDLLYLREENGKVYQYEDCCKTKSLRYSDKMNNKEKWERIEDKVRYIVLVRNGKLRTPFCNYKDLFVLRAEYSNGVTYDFYYQKGLGYIGATRKGELISYITPEN
ncbi:MULTISPECIES: hypothetical protein [Flavobacterium]|uniref:DKNYY family protein n=1 Tax=Flavobacterium jumunjinense TaxID=998845 RepID=A0ABV5GMY8_9FLAO|nr:MULTISPECIES: hypothetical protein [Flavobacterium]